jgi:diacylglycerol O-acyltransferase
MKTMALNDAMFLLGESRDHPAHVVAMQLWEPPADAAPDFLQQLHHYLVELDDIKPIFRRYPRKSALSPTRYVWRDDDDLDRQFHIRRLALPAPGRIRELLELVSSFHGVPLHRSRPLWDFQLVEGLADGRFASFFKTHHALADGMSLAQHVLGGLTTDPDARDCLPPWVRDPHEPQAAADATAEPGSSAGQLASIPRLTTSAVRAVRSMRRDTYATVPYEAPRSLLNVPITGARRFAGDSWPHERLKRVAVAASSTVNDVVLAMCGSALRSYLLELGQLPDRPLIAMAPVSLRRPGSGATPGEGNAFGAILCSLETHHEDPARRLDTIRLTMQAGKERLAGMPADEANMLSRILMGGAIVGALTGLTNTPRQPFNLIISNVPAGPQRLYWNGTALSEIYPVSMISEGQAMNFTVTRYMDRVAFGIVGCRSALPHLQRMLIHLDDALSGLEKAVIRWM